jgi:L-ascorbate metabolism protein UlaG (beta-lactamase superfamily)
MKITKLEHACLVIEEQGKRLIIDPGSMTTKPPTDLDSVAGVVITHVHADHYDAKHLSAIAAKNPGIQIFSTQEVARHVLEEMSNQDVTVVTDGSQGQAGPFALQFFGSQHAIIHKSIPPIQNVGVMVNRKLYYPGDSFEEPGLPIGVLAVPVSAPWMKLAEAMDFVIATKPTMAFPTHNALLSEVGQSLADRLVGEACETVGAKYTPLKPDSSLSV